MISIITLTGLGGYYTHAKIKNLIQEAKKIERLMVKTQKILQDNDRMKTKEAGLEKLLEDNKDFDIRKYFEQFIKEQSITPLANWDTETLPISGSDKFDEVSLNAVFKGQTTQKLIDIIKAIDKKQIVYIKALSIINEANKKITFEITMATKKHKRTL